MTVKNRLRNTLMRKIQQLSTDKLTEINNLLGKFESQFTSKEKTLTLAGSWKDMSEDILVDLTEKLHINRTNDRQIS